ncbi:hypothetical protein [Chamaesiphon sp. OTE_20_metabat_361]|uniref:hypothetical protein n=1 Tax=Chamaesiphon sp. OTE_20_metabat_361 TaxID=2964689 RepID=UPI00286B7608|nr:hypothetical protein [Chamaesiphon sp. OTE_20_metabat_361]
MSKRHARLWLFTLAFTVIFTQPFGKDGSGFQTSVAAKPLLQTAALGTQPPTNAPNDRISPPPVDAVLANVRLKPGSQPKAKRTLSTGTSRTIVTNRRNDNNPSLRGISHFIDTDRNANLTPVNRFIGR